ncbi:TetR family transcriptional regulator, partial [Burkholderia multivorans]
MSTRAGTTPAEPQTESAPRRRSRGKTREELQLAMLRVKNKGLKLSISAVATEAGVSAGLIHNTYPDIAEEIRAQVGRGTRQQRDAKVAEVKEVRGRLK